MNKDKYFVRKINKKIKDYKNSPTIAFSPRGSQKIHYAT